MPRPSLQLRRPRLEDEDAFKLIYLEFAHESPPWQFAFHFKPEGDFVQYLDKLAAWERGEDLNGFVPCSFYIGVVEGQIVGRLSLRHELNDFLRAEGGHIGYGVSPVFRGKGFATEMLRQALPICAEQGIERALVISNADNYASRRVIEKCGGLHESTDEVASRNPKLRRYWIPTS